MSLLYGIGVAGMDRIFSSLRAAVGCVAISGFWHEIASSKFSIFPRNDEKIKPRNNADIVLRYFLIFKIYFSYRINPSKAYESKYHH